MAGFDPDDTESTSISSAPMLVPVADPIEHLLLITAPDGQMSRMRIAPGAMKIGRVPGNDLVLPATEVSRNHAAISLTGGEVLLEDLGSTNGTLLEGQKLTAPVRLRNGSRITVGPFNLLYRRDTATALQRAELLEQELQRAGAYVKALLPPELDSGPMRASWLFVPSSDLGGDGFGYRRLPDGKFILWLLDVNGHGLGSALLAVSAMNALRAAAMPGGNPGDPAAVVGGLNGMFDMEEHDGLCFSIWYAVFDPTTRRLRYCSAGQHPAYLRVADHPAQPLHTRNPMIGAAQRINFAQAEATIPPGSRIYLFSDGAFEIIDLAGRQLTIRDFVPLLNEPAQPGLTEPERLLRSLRALNRPGPFEDDVSLLVVELD